MKLKGKLKKLGVWKMFKKNTVKYASFSYLDGHLKKGSEIGMFFVFGDTKQGLYFWIMVQDELERLK